MTEVIAAQSAPTDFGGQSVVIGGAFDPMLFQPGFLSSEGLLSEGDLEQLAYQVMAPEITVMRLPWMQVIVEPNKLVASTTPESPLWEPVWDFIFAFFDATPSKMVSAVGLNYDTHFAVGSEETWHQIGHQLVPKEQLWDKILAKPGTASVTIRGVRDDELMGHLNVKVEPSLRVHPGVYVNFNDHMEFGASGGERVLDIVGQKLVASRARWDTILSALKELTK